MAKDSQGDRVANAASGTVAEKKKIFRLGIMGGTFNPIHYGHLVAAEQARCKFNLDEVTFVPSGTPPHKQPRKLADSEHRYLMTVLATTNNPYFSISRTEIDRGGPSYAVDTIKHFLDVYSQYNIQIFFITGMDAVMEILTWRKPETIMELCTIIAATRPGFDAQALEHHIGEENSRAVKLLHASALAISSTDIRQRVADGLPIKYLLPDTVEQHIRKNRLYLEPG